MKKLYFENEDAENCYPEAYFQEKMKEEELEEITVMEANKSKEKEYIYCTAIDSCGEASGCGKQCEDYEPRNGKNGCCKHRRTIYEHGEEVTLKRKPVKVFIGLEKFGKVVQNEKIKNMYHIKITDGFKPNASNSKELFNLIMESIPEKNLVIEKFVTDNNLYHLILKTKEQ